MSPVIVLDRDIPFVEDIFSGIGEIVAVSGHEIGPYIVSRADAVIVRSITRIDETLLSGSSVTFVGTATAGIDHLDTEFLSDAGIRWSHAPGANAQSVVEYVLASISVIARRRNESIVGKTLGVIGCGQVGERLCKVAASLGMSVVRNDPPRAEREGGIGFESIQTCIRSSDILSIHTPLTLEGPFATHHLLDASLLRQAKPGAWLVQAARGGVVHERDALAARREGILGALVLDVFENEPTPSEESIHVADLATGHIAGYSRDAKRNGVLMMREAVINHFGLVDLQEDNSIATESVGDRVVLPVEIFDPEHPTWMESVVRQVYDIRSDDARFRRQMKNALEKTTAFHRYRAHYPARYAWSRFSAQPRNDKEARVLAALGFNVTRGASDQVE
ncbi:MAG: 4-phosphoerythronate dehydrogenase [Rhodothermales bacterium]